MSDNEEKDGAALAIEFERALEKEEQVTLSYKLQTLLLKTYEKRLLAGIISDTGLAALQRLLHANGWSLDPAQLPSDLRSKLTTNVSADEIDEDDKSVLPIRKRA